MLTTSFANLIPKFVVDAILTDATVFSFNRMTLQLTAHATQDWLHATAVTLLQSMNGRQTRHSPDLNLLDYHLWGALAVAGDSCIHPLIRKETEALAC